MAGFFFHLRKPAITQRTCQGSHFNLKLFVLSDKSFLGNSQRLSASRRCFCFQETRRREEEKSLCLPSVCVYMCASQDTEGMWDRGSTGCHFDRSLDPFSQCCHIFQRFFFIYFLLYDVCSDPVISIQQRFFFFFSVFSQSLWAFSRSVGKMLNYKEHQSALFQDVVCSSNTIKCLYKGPGARNKLTHIVIKF